MKRKMLTVFLLAWLICMPALAESAPDLQTDMTSRAKEALQYLSTGDWDGVRTALNWSGADLDDSDWAAFQARFTLLAGTSVQAEVSVAFLRDGAWVVAVPVTEPDSDDAETLMLLSSDGTTFRDIAKAPWESVLRAVDASDQVIWDIEYTPQDLLILGDE